MPGSATKGTTIPIGFDLSQIVADARKLTASMNEITTSVNSFSDSVKTNFGQMAEAMKTINTTVESIAKSGFKELSDTVNSLDFKSTIDQMKELVELMGKIEIKQSAGSKGGGSGGSSGSDEAKKQKDTYEHISMITKSITEDMHSQAKVIRGIASDGAAIVEVVDKAGDVIKQTKTTTDAQVIDAKNLLTTLKEQTAEMNKQKTLYVDMMKNPSALPSDQLAAQKAYEESRSKVTGTMNTINNATQIKDIISGVDSALASAQSKLDSAEAQVNRIMTSVNEATKQQAAQDYADKIKKATDNLNQQIRLRQQITQLELKGVNASKSTQTEYARLVNLRQQDLDALQASYATLVRTTPELQNEETLLALIKQYTDLTAKGMTDVEDAVEKANAKLFSFSNVLEQAQIKLVRMVAQKAFQMIADSIRAAVEYCTQFYDKLNEIRVVTGKTQVQADALGESFRDIARNMGVSSQEIADAGITYYRQGLNDEEVEDRIKSTIEYSKAAAISAGEASEYITATTNALGVEAERVADVYLYLGDHAATSGEEIGRAMSRASGTAKAAGISFEMLGAYIATVSETTRQEAGSIGTALNAIMTRLTQVKQKGYNEEDETKVNDVAKALARLGIQLVDANGNWRDMEDIFQEIGAQWAYLDDKTQNYLATVMAGVRQQNTFRIIMEDLSKMNDMLGDGSRIMELYSGAMDSAGTAAQKMSTWQESYTSSQQNLLAEWEEFVSHIDITSILKEVNNGLAELLGLVNNALNPQANLTPYKQAEEQLKRILELRNYAGNGSDSLMYRMADIFGYNQGGLNESEAENTFSEIVRLGEIAKKMASDRGGLLGVMDVAKGVSGYGISSYLDKQAIMELVKYFAPDGTWDDAVYDAWVEWCAGLGTHMRNAVTETEFGDVSKELASSLAVLFEDTVNNLNDYAGTDFDGQALMNTMLTNMLGKNWTVKDLDENVTGLVNDGIQAFYDAFNNIWQSVSDIQFGNNMVTGDVAKYVEKDVRAQIDAFNKLYGTNLSYETLAETINPLDPDSPLAQEQAALRETEEAAKALQAQIQELFAQIDGSYAHAAEIKRQQDLGFKDWLDSFYEQLRDADNVETETEFTDVLNSYLEGKVKDPEFYKALEKEYTQLGELQEALKANDGTKAFLLFQEMMADYTEKTAKAMTEEEKAAQKQQEKLDAWIESRKTASETKALTESGFASWIEQIRAFGEAENGSGLYDWFISQDEKLRDSFLAMYPPLDDFMTLLLTNKGNIGWMKGAWEGLNNLKGAIPTADETKKLDAFLKTVQKSDQKAKVEEAKKNKFVVERGQLMSFFSAGRNDIISQLQGYMNGNVDLTLRPVIDSSELKKAGWDEEGGGIATLFSETFANQAGTIGFTATPILPNGKVLTQKEFYEYIDQLMSFSNASEMIKFDKENKGLLINWLGIPEGEDVEEFLNEYAKVGEALHNLHEQLYAGDSRSGFDQAGLLSQLMTWQEDGTLAALYSSIEGLEPLISRIILDGQDGFIDDTEALQQLQDLLFSTKTAWDQYVEAKTKAFNDSVSSDAEGAALLTHVSAAIDTGTLGELWVSLTEDEQEFIESTVDGFDKYIAGAEDATEVTKELGSEIGSLNLSQGITDGTALAGSDSWYKDAISGSKAYYASLAKADSTARELAEGWETLVLLQSDVKLSTKELTAAYEILASATDLSKEQLAGPGGLQLAEQSLATSTSQVSGTVEILLGEIQRMTGMNFSTGPLRAQLDALRASADAPTLRVLDLIDALLKLNGMESRATVIVDQVGGLSLSGGGGWFDAAKGGLSKAWSGVKNALQNYKNKSTAVQSRASGGGGGGGSKNETDNLKSEIEKMIHMMDEVQKIWDHHFDMLEAVRNDFEQDKLLQGVMLYYQKESDAIAENNKTLEENLKQIEALLPKQQALVSSMSTTDEEYEKASADLEKLQSAHQKYSKQLVENQTKIKEYAEKIKETRDKIRDMEIDLRNTILKAIQDREALEKSMRDARISMENEVYDAIKRRYEKERDLILDNAKTRKDALNEEKSLLDENLNKRKEAQEQQEKQAQLLQLQQKLVRISADPTRQAERLSIQKQIKDLQDELAWTEAEDEVEAQKESIDNQIKNLDDYMEYVTAYYDDIFEHPKQLLAEVEQIMNMTDTEILDWMKANSEEWDQSSASSQAKMLEGWTTTLREMHGQLELYWDEVEYIISQGDDYIIEFLKQNSAEYREAGKLQAEAYVDQWREQLEDLRLAHQAVVDDMQQYSYSTIRLSESSGSSSSGGGGGGGNSGGSTKKKIDYLDPDKVDAVIKVGDGIMSGISTALTGLANAFSGKTTVGRTTGNGILNLGSSEFSPGSTSSNKLYNQAMVNMRNTTASGVTKGSITSGVTLSKSTSASTPKVSISSIGSGVKKLFGFASGGEMDETGFAILHGKPGRPERVLDPVSTELFNTLVADLHEIKRIPVNFGTFSAPNIDTTGTGNTMFGDINISVETLSSDEDYEEIADRIMEVINERMGRGRAVGGIRRSR